jgi:DNA polymerase III alpha subunit
MSSPLTQLAERKLWYDGTVEVEPEQLPRQFMLGIPLSKLAVSEMTSDVHAMNAFNDAQVTVKRELTAIFPPDWSIPDAYKYLDINEYLIGLAAKVERDELYEQRLQRLALEIELFEQHDLIEVLRMLIYVVDEMTRQHAVWGVGRGSSCSSYLLYLIGLHEVDVVLFDIPITDFIHS